MIIDKFKAAMMCNEPDFRYNGQDYSICHPDGRYYVTASDSPGDVDLTFDTLDSLLDGWVIQGKPLREILPNIEFD